MFVIPMAISGAYVAYAACHRHKSEMKNKLNALGVLGVAIMFLCFIVYGEIKNNYLVPNSYQFAPATLGVIAFIISIVITYKKCK